MKKILRKIKEQYNKWLHKRRCGAIEKFRGRMMEAYPEMANFAERIQMMQGYNDIFELKGSLCISGQLSVYGLSTSYREWEENTIKEIERKYPDLKVLLFHYTPDEADGN